LRRTGIDASGNPHGLPDYNYNNVSLGKLHNSYIYVALNPGGLRDRWFTGVQPDQFIQRAEANECAYEGYRGYHPRPYPQAGRHFYKQGQRYQRHAKHDTEHLVTTTHITLYSHGMFSSDE